MKIKGDAERSGRKLKISFFKLRFPQLLPGIKLTIQAANELVEMIVSDFKMKLSSTWIQSTHRKIPLEKEFTIESSVLGAEDEEKGLK